MTSLSHSTEIISRIRFLLDTCRMSQARFAKRISIDPANLSKHLSGKLPVTSGLINRIAVDMGVSKKWLTTGEGVPFAKDDGIRPDGNATPVYDIDVTAGCYELSRMFTADRIIGYVDIPDMRPGSSIVRVSGDSMEPEISDGAYVAIRPISDMSCIFWGQIYVIVMDDYRMVKHVQRHPDPSKIILRSSNPQYDDMEVSRDKIRRMFVVETILNLKNRC